MDLMVWSQGFSFDTLPPPDQTLCFPEFHLCSTKCIIS
jgi:hypothetical protein